MKFSLKNLFSSVWNLLFPSLCQVCAERPVAIGQEICANCLSHIPRTNFHLQKENPMEKRLYGRVDVERATAFFFFQKGSAYRRVLHELKYNSNPEIGRVLALHAAAELLASDDFKNFDFIVPVPLHKNKFRKRGYNQSAVIAQGLAEILNSKVDEKTLIRQIENPTQTKKSTYERWENTNGIFALTSPEVFAGKKLLLVDDVMTTGSTLIACAEAIYKEVPDARISFFSLALAM